MPENAPRLRQGASPHLHICSFEKYQSAFQPRLFSFIMCDFVHQCIHKLLLRHLFDDLAAAEDQAHAVAARNAEIGFTRLAGTVYHAAHNGYLHLLAANALAALLDLFGNVDEVDARAAAGRAGNDVDALLRASDGAQDDAYKIWHRSL